jgi:ubiquinone/menaquinone biosynthesis C-methylase UbiE
MNTNRSSSLQEAIRKAEAISKSAAYQHFLEEVKHQTPWRFERDSTVIDRDYLRIVDHHLRKLIPVVQGCIGTETRRVLDFGCGSGGSAIALAMLFPNIRCVGTDVDSQEVSMAVKRAEVYEVQDRCQFVAVRENQPLPFPDSSFDFCLCSSVLEYVPDKEARKFCVREMSRLIAPGGVLFVSGPNRLYPFEVHSWWNGKPKWGWNYFPKLLRADTVDTTVWEVQKLARPDVLRLHNTPLLQLFKPWSNFCLKKGAGTTDVAD